MRRFAPLLLTFALPACGTIVAGTNQSITVTTNPAEATCTLDRRGERIGAIARTPGSVQISKSSRPVEVTCSKEGFQTVTVSHKPDFAAVTAGNLLLGGPVGIIVDAASGASSVYPAEVKVTLVVALDSLGRVAETSGMTVSTALASPLLNTRPLQETIQPTKDGRFRCPAIGTWIERSDGTRLLYRGSDSTNPAMCVIIVNGRETKSFYGLWPADEGNTSPAYSTLHRLMEGGPGEMQAFDSDGSAGVFGNVGRYQEQWKIIGPDTVSVGGQQRQATKIVHETRGAFGASIFWRHQIWLDAETGIEVKHTSEQVRGIYSPAPNWTVLDLPLSPSA